MFVYTGRHKTSHSSNTRLVKPAFKQRLHEQFFPDKFSWQVRFGRLFGRTSFPCYLKTHPRHWRFSRRNRSKPVKMAARRALASTTLCDFTHALTGLVVQRVFACHRVAECARRSSANFPCCSVGSKASLPAFHHLYLSRKNRRNSPVQTG